MKLISSACPRNCYSTCSFKVGVEDNIVKSIEPHEQNLATPDGQVHKGTILCGASKLEKIEFCIHKNVLQRANTNV